MDIIAKNYKNLKWNITAPNKVDTVKFSPMINLLENEPAILGTNTIDLPIDDPSNAALYWRSYRNVNTVTASNFARFEFSTIYFETTFVTSEPITSDVTITLSDFEGSSFRLTSEEKSVRDLLAYHESSIDSLAQLIYSNRTNVSSDIYTPLQNDKFPTNMYAWTTPGTWYFKPTPGNKSNIGNFDSNYIPYYYIQEQVQVRSNSDFGWYTWRGGYFYYGLNLEKISDYEFKVSGYIPNRIACMMVCDDWYSYANPYYRSFGFYDQINRFSISISAIKRNMETSDRTYSLDSNGNLTTQLKNNYPTNLSMTNELFTLDTYKETSDKIWYQELSKEILTKYKNGKNYITLDVKHTYLLQNAIDADTLLQVKLFNGTYISRNNVPCIFRVKNIIYKFRADESICQLYLLEE